MRSLKVTFFLIVLLVTSSHAGPFEDTLKEYAVFQSQPWSRVPLTSKPVQSLQSPVDFAKHSHGVTAESEDLLFRVYKTALQSDFFKTPESLFRFIPLLEGRPIVIKNILYLTEGPHIFELVQLMATKGEDWRKLAAVFLTLDSQVWLTYNMAEIIGNSTRASDSTMLNQVVHFAEQMREFVESTNDLMTDQKDDIRHSLVAMLQRAAEKRSIETEAESRSAIQNILVFSNKLNWPLFIFKPLFLGLGASQRPGVFEILKEFARNSSEVSLRTHALHFLERYPVERESLQLAFDIILETPKNKLYQEHYSILGQSFELIAAHLQQAVKNGVLPHPSAIEFLNKMYRSEFTNLKYLVLKVAQKVDFVGAAQIVADGLQSTDREVRIAALDAAQRNHSFLKDMLVIQQIDLIAKKADNSSQQRVANTILEIFKTLSNDEHKMCGNYFLLGL